MFEAVGELGVGPAVGFCDEGGWRLWLVRELGLELEVEVGCLRIGAGGGVVFSASHWRKRERASQSR